MSSTQAATAQAKAPGSGNKIYIAFVPWVLFTLVAQHSTLKLGAALALVAAIVIAIPGIVNGRPKLLELGAVITFAAFAVLAFTADHSVTTWMARYARGIAAAVLALIAFGSLLVTPFTEQYARESVPKQFWGSPQFKQINRKLTMMWGSVFLAMIPFHIAAGLLDHKWSNIAFNWVVPIYLLVWAGKRTAAVSGDDGDARPQVAATR